MSSPTRRRVGRQLSADLNGIRASLLADGRRVMEILQRLLRENGFRQLETLSHQFGEGGGGFTGLVILAESHAAVHTYPEIGYLALDIFACGESEPRPVAEQLAAELAATAVDLREDERGPAAPTDPA